MAMLVSTFTGNNDQTQVPTSAPTTAAYVAWIAKNCTTSVIYSAKYNLGQMAKYYKILKREGKFPIS